jgi:hypothetical protein
MGVTLLAAVAAADEVPNSVLFLYFKTDADMPQYDYYGNGVEITNGEVPRSGIVAAGVQLRGTRSSHNHERWIVQWFNPAGQLWSADTLEYTGVVGSDPSANYCWQYQCALGTTYRTWRTFTSFFQPNCSMRLEDGWKWKLVWQYSDEVGPVTPTWSAEAVVQERTFKIGVSLGALSMTTDATIVHPASESSTGGITQTSFDGGISHIAVHARDCGNPPPQPINVRINANPVEHSAGHNHDAPPLSRVATFDTMTCTTDKSGNCTITMTGVGASSLLKLKAHADDWDTSDSVTTPVDSEEFNMAVAMPLDEMSFDTSFVMPTGDTTIHPQNHFAQPEMISFINLFAKHYADSHGGDRVRIDDMSLPLGGVFDRYGTYSPSHAFHRFGVDVDVSAHVIDATGTLVTDGLDVDDLTDYIETVLDGSRYPEGPIHYRFPANGIDEIIRTRIR